MQRHTIETLRNSIMNLNKAAGYPETGLKRDDEGRLRPVPGAYVLDGAYGGYRLNRYTIGGGETHVTDRHPAGIAYDLVLAYTEGLKAGIRKGSSDAVSVFARAEEARQGITTPTIDQHIPVGDIRLG